MPRFLAVLTLMVAFFLFGEDSRAQTGHVKGNYIGCLTEDYLDQMFTALNSKDQNLINSLYNKVCFSVEGREFSVLDRSGFLYSISKIRVYVGSDHVDLYVPSEATR